MKKNHLLQPQSTTVCYQSDHAVSGAFLAEEGCTGNYAGETVKPSPLRMDLLLDGFLCSRFFVEELIHIGFHLITIMEPFQPNCNLCLHSNDEKN